MPSSCPRGSGGPALIEVQLAKQWQGKVVAHTDKISGYGQDGWMRVCRPTTPQVPQDFAAVRSWTGSVLRDNLRREFGRPFEIVGTRHYIVLLRIGDQKARAYAETFEELFRSFQMYFSVRGFKINEPEFPLMAIVFPDFDSFSR